jgi:hypothetical protein
VSWGTACKTPAGIVSCPGKGLERIELRRNEPFDPHLAGSGELTLSLDLGGSYPLKKIVDSMAVITNSTRSARRFENCPVADVVLPSLDAASQTAFQAINRPSALKRDDPGLRTSEGIFREIW